MDFVSIQQKNLDGFATGVRNIHTLPQVVNTQAIKKYQSLIENSFLHALGVTMLGAILITIVMMILATGIGSRGIRA
ncbi:hypothetical protein [Legionella tunisiensis]|uniref:hypothetical protein n=1 Tax=Legionella tunisiensis TaxID=1034944 RepID=UPI000367221F|nr:hypothetical protein [Legionella tunisiensis]